MKFCLSLQLHACGLLINKIVVIIQHILLFLLSLGCFTLHDISTDVQIPSHVRQDSGLEIQWLDLRVINEFVCFGVFFFLFAVYPFLELFCTLLVSKNTLDCIYICTCLLGSVLNMQDILAIVIKARYRSITSHVITVTVY